MLHASFLHVQQMLHNGAMVSTTRRLLFACLFIVASSASGFFSRIKLPARLVNSSTRLDLNTSKRGLMIVLTTSCVENAIENVTKAEDELARTLSEKKNIKVERIQDWETVLKDLETDLDAETYLETKTPWHFGLSLRDDNTKEIVGIITFHFAYSTWNGRILYVDCLQSSILDDETEVLLLRILANIAVNLDCARLTWRHNTTPAWHSKGSNRPETHDEVLTLSMNETAMSTFIENSSLNEVEPLEGPFSKHLVQSAFDRCLEKVNGIGDTKFRLRLAKTEEDVGAMMRLIQELADYQHESDAVHMVGEDYVQDGLSLEFPLWYCILVEKIDEMGSSHICGYAFIFAGYTLGQGRFLYLEDLYLEVEHRGGGGGKTIMKTLAGLCRAMNCKHLFWQALDWNNLALKFYESIGAKIHLNEKTSRYAGDALKGFAQEWSP